MRRTANIRNEAGEDNKISRQRNKQKTPMEEAKQNRVGPRSLEKRQRAGHGIFSECFAAGDDISKELGESCVAVMALSAILCRQDTSAHESVLMGHGLLG